MDSLTLYSPAAFGCMMRRRRLSTAAALGGSWETGVGMGFGMTRFADKGICWGRAALLAASGGPVPVTASFGACSTKFDGCGILAGKGTSLGRAALLAASWSGPVHATAWLGAWAGPVPATAFQGLLHQV